MPKYGGSPARRKASRRRTIVLSTLVASALVGGGALASNGLQSGGQSEPQAIADDTLSVARELGTPGPKPKKDTPHKYGWHKVQRPKPSPTPTATPTPTTEPTQEPSREPEPTATAEPATEQPTAPEEQGPFPTMETTGPRTSDLSPSEGITTSETGQVIEGLDVDGPIKIIHDDATVRDVRITHTGSGGGQYALHIAEKSNGECPQNVVIQHIEIVGDKSELADDAIALYGACPFTLQESRIYDVGSAVRITDGSHIEGNFLRGNFYNPDSGTHRSALGLNGGADHVITGNTIDCEGPGCSGAFVMYGDFAQVRNVLVEHNLLNTTGSYCTYAGSLDAKEHPVAEDVRYIDNHFGQKYFDTCGRYGPVSGRDSNGGPGFVWEGNVWADTGKLIE
ncbi:right-handed parallel beta-helix repeat-containing protein [Jiangella asiatica]|uniref:Uncharacterized protein n=1 Tax=Jiangella asiatica TaxID=2530372 RepID=A0A4V2YZY8_9ACTN|nr:right-handed parallel beta-helix repeat-containing protein [Jiangella asiatica]TDD98957.1 hypothetical protein E1269_28165 [Jiangella asiatica]